MDKDVENLFKDKVFGHPAGLFVLFFTEMWERFSYYGMRAILVIFLISAMTGENPGWAWARENALSLLGTYALLVYLTPILGGYIADKKIGKYVVDSRRVFIAHNWRALFIAGCLIFRYQIGAN